MRSVERLDISLVEAGWHYGKNESNTHKTALNTASWAFTGFPPGQFPWTTFLQMPRVYSKNPDLGIRYILCFLAFLLTIAIKYRHTNVCTYVIYAGLKNKELNTDVFNSNPSPQDLFLLSTITYLCLFFLKQNLHSNNVKTFTQYSILKKCPRSTLSM
jgi:hypothetical protein